MSRCPLLYVEIPDGLQYSREGLRTLHPKLEQLHDFPLTAEEQLHEAAALAAKISIQGVQPKLSVRLDAGTGTFRVVETLGQYIVKPPNPAFPQLPENEDLTMRLASISGIDVPFHGLIYAKDGSMSYLIRRFDRIGRKGKLAAEDFAQLGGFSRETKYDSSVEQVIRLIETFTTFPAVEKLKLFARILFCFLTGNEDMHLKNYSIITSKGGIHRLSPAYDLLNTTIALRTAEEESALPLRGRKRNLTRKDLVEYLGSERLELPPQAIDTVLSRFRQAIPEYRRLIEISFLSDDQKRAYTDLLTRRSLVLGFE